MIIINENSELKKNKYKIPKSLTNHLKQTLSKYKDYSTNKGYKRLNSLVNPKYNVRSDDNNDDEKYVSYNDLKRIDFDLRHMDKKTNNIERVLNGGEKMANFVHDTLNRERNKVSPVLKRKKQVTRAKNVVKPTKNPTKVEIPKINENKKIFLNENQLFLLKNLDF